LVVRVRPCPWALAARAAVARFPDACISAAFIHFPDPWWKRRHHKRLVVANELTLALQRVLTPAGELFVQTDVEERAQAYFEILSQAPSL
jgi:tRNA (guanine-N7-)-methyltransferase